MKIERIETNGEEQRIRQEFGVSELCAKVLACRCQDDEQIRQVLISGSDAASLPKPGTHADFKTAGHRASAS